MDADLGENGRKKHKTNRRLAETGCKKTISRCKLRTRHRKWCTKPRTRVAYTD